MNKPLVSFITVNYNGLRDTVELIKSIHETVFSISYEIIVVDNASTTDEAHKLREFFDDIIVIQSEKNLGFAGGNNMGIKLATADYFFFINNDTLVSEDHFSELINKMDETPMIGGISPKLKFAYSPKNIQFAGFSPLSSITLRNEILGYGQPDEGQYEIAHVTPYLHGAAMLISRKVCEVVGLMSNIFFLYYEEMDWCTRIRKAGYELWYDPIQTIYHKESQSTGKASKLQIYYLTRNRLLYAWRNLHGIKRLLSLIYLSTISATKNSLHFCIKGNFSLAITIYKAIFAFITLPNKKK